MRDCTPSGFAGIGAMQNSLVVHQKVKYRVPIWPNNSTPRYMQEKKTVTKNVCMNVHSSIFRTAKEQAQPKHLPSDEQIKCGIIQSMEMWYIHSAMKRNGTTWMSLENMLSERSQIQKANSV